MNVVTWLPLLRNCQVILQSCRVHAHSSSSEDTSSLSMFSEHQPLVSLFIVSMVMGVTVSPCGDRDVYPLVIADAEHPFWTCFHLCFLPFAYFYLCYLCFIIHF